MAYGDSLPDFFEPEVSYHAPLFNCSHFIACDNSVRSANFPSNPLQLMGRLGEEFGDFLRVVGPVRCDMPKATECQPGMDEFEDAVLNDPTFVMSGFLPGVWE